MDTIYNSVLGQQNSSTERGAYLISPMVSSIPRPHSNEDGNQEPEKLSSNLYSQALKHNAHITHHECTQAYTLNNDNYKKILKAVK